MAANREKLWSEENKVTSSWSNFDIFLVVFGISCLALSAYLGYLAYQDYYYPDTTNLNIPRLPSVEPITPTVLNTPDLNWINNFRDTALTSLRLEEKGFTPIQTNFYKDVIDGIVDLIGKGCNRTVIENSFGPTSNIIQTPEIAKIMETFSLHANLVNNTTLNSFTSVVTSNTDLIAPITTNIITPTTTSITTPTIPDQEWINNFKQLCLNKMNLDARVIQGRLPIANAELYTNILDEVCRLIRSGQSNNYIVNHLIPDNKIGSTEIFNIFTVFLEETRKLDNSTISLVESVTPLINPVENLSSMVRDGVTNVTVNNSNVINNWDKPTLISQINVGSSRLLTSPIQFFSPKRPVGSINTVSPEITCSISSENISSSLLTRKLEMLEPLIDLLD